MGAGNGARLQLSADHTVLRGSPQGREAAWVLPEAPNSICARTGEQSPAWWLQPPHRPPGGPPAHTQTPPQGDGLERSWVGSPHRGNFQPHPRISAAAWPTRPKPWPVWPGPARLTASSSSPCPRASPGGPSPGSPPGVLACPGLAASLASILLPQGGCSPILPKATHRLIL